MRRRLLAAGWIALVGALAGCEDPITTGGPAGPDLTTVASAMDALEQAYSYRRAEEAISFLAPSYRFLPAFPESIGFLAPGETEWSRDREVLILEQLLVEERTSWIDQVLLAFFVLSVDTLPDGSVEVTTKTDLTLSLAGNELEQSRSTIVLVYRRNEQNLWLLHEERESPWDGSSRSVGELKSEVLGAP